MISQKEIRGARCCTPSLIRCLLLVIRLTLLYELTILGHTDAGGIGDYG